MRTTTIKGKTFVLVPAKQWEKLTEMPPLPTPKASGNVDAIEYGRASIARTIITRRIELGLSQAELARRAGVRIETLNRIEKAKVSADTRTITKIDTALTSAAKATNVRRKRPA